MREHIKADEPFERSECHHRRGARPLHARGRGLQGRADRGPDPRPGRRPRLAVPQRPVPRPLPRPARPVHQAHQGVQAHRVAGAYWRGDSSRHDAHARLRHRLRLQGGPGGAPRSAWRRRAPATTASSGRELGLFMFSELSPGLAVLAAERRGAVERADRPVAHRERGPRLHRGPHADPLRLRAVEAVGPLARLPRQHVLHRRGGPAHGPQAHELPRPRAAVQVRARAPTASCRCGWPSRASCTATSPAARCTACCGCGTSPRTTPTSSAPRTSSRRRSSAAWTSASSSTTCSASSRAWSSRPGPTSGWAPTRCGTGPRRCSSRRWTTAAWSTSSTRATAPSTARRSTCT